MSGAPDALVAGSTQDFCEALAQNTLLASIDQMWNANPLREVVPIDWAGIAHALRIVGLRSLANPGRAISTAAEFNANVLRSAAETWNDAIRRWWGSAPLPRMLFHGDHHEDPIRVRKPP
jgi:polyhydroxyalkanoate synthase